MNHITRIILFLSISSSIYGQSNNCKNSIEINENDTFIFYVATNMRGELALENGVGKAGCLVSFLKTNKEWKFELICHTDSRGNASSNAKLSEVRAENLKFSICRLFLIDSDRITTSGMGESKPIIPEEVIDKIQDSNKIKDAHTINRRYELRAIEKNK